MRRFNQFRIPTLCYYGHPGADVRTQSFLPQLTTISLVLALVSATFVWDAL